MDESLERFGRHAEFIPSNEQQKLLHAKVLLAGCGAGSPLAANLVRLGIATGNNGEIVLADPDTVDIGNLNRQDYSEDDIGQNKAAALSARIKHINSTVNTKVITEGVTFENVGDLTSHADVIVDMIDIAAPEVMLRLHREAEAAKKPVVTGLDVGEGVITYVFDYRNKENMTIQGFLGLPDAISDEELKQIPSLALAAQLVVGPVKEQFATAQEAIKYYESFFDENNAELLAKLPKEMHQVLEKLLTGKLDFIPQINSAAAQLGVLQSVIVKELLLGNAVKIAPQAISLNLLDLVKL